MRQTHLAPPDLRVRPRMPLPLPLPQEHLGTGRPVLPPPLIKDKLCCGGRVQGPLAWNSDFGTADLPMMLRLGDLPAAYQRRFMGLERHGSPTRSNTR